jgi:hypothetical protein
MELKELKPRKALNKAFLKVKPNRTEIEGFKTNLITLLDRTNDTESEEFHKNLVSDFLKDTYYKQNHFINTKGRNDLVIHNGQNADSTVGVILEAKKPTNKSEMITTKKLNAKAFQELVLYYLRERITHKNLEVKHLVATNINEWFIFDATLFDRLFAQNKNLVKQFNDFEAGRLADTKTEFFYKQVAEPFIDSITSEIEFTYFNIQNFQKPLRNTDKADDNSLIALFKLLSPEHLLKLPFTNDSNSLDKRFYSELLHIIGLTETKEGSKKLIERNKAGERHTGTILEDAIIQLDSLDKLSRLEKQNQFGNTQQERLFNVALELSITWINRILFLKLLEAQLITYHKGDKSYSFLNLDKIKNYDDLNSLFFQVLARKYDERNEDVKKIFEKVPYLNSSLFEPTDIEQVTLFISNLKDDKTIPAISSTVLKDKQGKKRTGNLTTLEYLFEFLDAYDFGAEGGEEIQEDNKTLINASVLGLIFEKINGYKDGSFFTPGFITMYMCRETIRKAVVQKFNETKKWNCNNIEELYDKIEDRKEANKIVNSIKICDPAVGSGHFLVSALNEMIAVKNDLKILQDRDGKRLKEYQVEVVNDELIVTDEEGELFEYNPSNKESQRIQETLFHEKQTIIENCLFGVDINSNSVKICRLRLWIELLKNAYYKNSTELETLPNIDINIKCGNSLVSRFAIDADLKQALKKSKWTIDSYRIAVDTYRNAESKEQKREMERLIADIKSDFRSEISLNDPKVKKLRKLSSDLYQMTNQGQLFEMSKKEKTDWNKKVTQLTEETKKLEAEIEEIKANKIFENAFEWRFEFPEVLNDDGDFVGFDVVIGNPPYLRVESVSERHANFYKKEYKSASGKFDVSSLFIELGISLIAMKGKLSYISTYQFIYTGSAIGLREFIMNNTKGSVIMFSSTQQIFEDATTYTGIFQFEKGTSEIFKIQNANVIGQTIIETNVLNLTKSNFISKRVIVDDADLVEKLKTNKNTVLGIEIGVAKCGVVSSCDDVFFVQEKQISEFHLERELIYPILGSEDLSRYHLSIPQTYCIYPYNEVNSKTSLIDEKQLNDLFPNISNYFKTNESILRERSQGRTSYEKSSRWYQLNRPREKWIYNSKKIIAPGTTNNPKFALDLVGAVFRNARLYSFILKDENIAYYKLILGILNSKLSHYFMTLLCPPKNNGYYELSTTFLEDFPYPIWSIDNELQIKLISKVQDVISNKEKNENSDTTSLELEIDHLVYKIYDLTPEDINIVENSIKK